MFLPNSVYPLSFDGTLSAHINDNHGQVSRCKSYYQKRQTGLNRQENSPLAPCLAKKS